MREVGHQVRLAFRLFVTASVIVLVATLAFLLQPSNTVDVTLIGLATTLFYLAWPVLLASVIWGLIAWFRGARPWWVAMVLLLFGGLTWLVGCGIPAADLS